MDRSDLYALVDALPESTLENAKRILEHLSHPPQEIERMGAIRREQFFENMKRSMKPGTAAAAGGGGSFNPTAGYGHSGHARWEGQTAVHETHHSFRGHEIEVTERLRLTDDGKLIHYTFQATGPNGDAIRNEIAFGLK